MAIEQWLIDKSAYARLPQAVNAEEWMARVIRGLVRTSVVTRLEIGFSFRSGEQGRRESALPPLSLMPIEYFTAAIENRALEVQLLLADKGQHRSASVPDLLIAATAEKLGLIVLHVDKDFDLIAEVTGQPVERLRIG
ncbi:MAG: PIN domain nuclease [Propionibacteriaceae bacterium]|jgi:predicted nucleic acid-binding protein|nr:PIN domain nuclease [Propionibacteriaceae bacterium]